MRVLRAGEPDNAVLETVGSRHHQHRWQFLPRRATRIASGLTAAVFSALALFSSGSGDARNFASLAGREQICSQRESYSHEPRHARLVTKAIEEIRPGDVVLAREEHGTKLAPRRVTQVFRRTTDHLRILEIADAAGARQTLKTPISTRSGSRAAAGSPPATSSPGPSSRVPPATPSPWSPPSAIPTPPESPFTTSKSTAIIPTTSHAAPRDRHRFLYIIRVRGDSMRAAEPRRRQILLEPFQPIQRR